MPGNFFGCSYDIGADAVPLSSTDLRRIAFEIVRPKASPKPLIRVGPDGDGGYLIPDDLDGIKTCFSPGVSNRKQFEDELTKLHDITCHMCDFSSDESKFSTPLIPGKQTFRKTWLDVVNNASSISLDQWILEAAPAGERDFILQMDIEGAEFRNILACSPANLDRFRILIFELHNLHEAFLNDDILQQVFYPFLRKIGASFTCVHAHPNNYGGEVFVEDLGINMPLVLELTFINNDRLNSVSQDAYVFPMLPHPLDISPNSVENPPMVFSDKWLSGTRSLKSQQRIIEDEVGYQRHRTSLASFELSEAMAESIRTVTALTASGDSASSPAAAPSAPSRPLEEIAVGRRYLLSSSFGNRVTGSVPDTFTNYFFHTALGNNQSITIDLMEVRAIERVIIGNRRDDCFDRAKLLYIVFRPEAIGGASSVFRLDGSAEFNAGKTLLAELETKGAVARYVTILSPLYTALHFSSLQFMAKPLASV